MILAKRPKYLNSTYNHQFAWRGLLGPVVDKLNSDIGSPDSDAEPFELVSTVSLRPDDSLANPGDQLREALYTLASRVGRIGSLSLRAAGSWHVQPVVASSMALTNLVARCWLACTLTFTCVPMDTIASLAERTP